MAALTLGYISISKPPERLFFCGRKFRRNASSRCGNPPCPGPQPWFSGLRSNTVESVSFA